MRFLLSTLLLLPTAALADWPAGADLSQQVVVDLTPAGLDAAGGILDTVVPGSIAIPRINDYGCEEECAWLLGCWCWYEYEYDVDNGWVSLNINSLDIMPVNPTGGYSAQVNIAANITVQVNSQQNPIYIYAYGGVIDGLIGIDEQCDAWVDPFDVQVDLPVYLQLVTDPATGDTNLDVMIPPAGPGGLEWDWTLDGSDVNIANCLISDIDDVMSFFGLDIYDLILDAATPLIDDLIASLPAELEPTIEEAASGINIATEVDLLGTPLSIELYPDTLETTNAGLRIGLGGSISAPADPCVAKYGITESLATLGDAGAIGSAPTAIPFNHHAGIAIDDDLVNQALFSVWNAGVLCQTIDDGFSADLPIAINSDLLPLLAPGAFDEFFPETEPIIIKTEPIKPPTAAAQGAHDVNIKVEDLGLLFYGKVDGREVRLFQLDLGLDAGADLDFDGTTGMLDIGVALDSSNLSASVSYNELAPDSNGVIENGIGSLFDTLVGPLLDSLLSDLSFALPQFSGLGLTELAIAPTGSTQTHIGAFATLGPVSYGDPDAGCGCDDGSGGGGCDSGGGCSTSNGFGRGIWVLFPLVLAGLRRRRR